VACAVLALGYCGFVLVDAWVFQKRASRDFERLLRDRRTAGGGTSQTGSPTSAQGLPAIAPGSLIGRIEIPRLGISAVVAEGIDNPTLRRAVGHIPGTGMPGQPGNVCLAGHRDTFFRPLRNVRSSDVITLITLQGAYRYRVVSAKVVSAYDVAVLDPSANEVLTLVTCFPFDFVGSAPNRFIVRAERVTG
jgi:sortase A